MSCWNMQGDGVGLAARPQRRAAWIHGGGRGGEHTAAKYSNGRSHSGGIVGEAGTSQQRSSRVPRTGEGRSSLEAD